VPGVKARLSGLWVIDREVAPYAVARPDQLIGFMSLMVEERQDLKMKRIKLGSVKAGFSPNDQRFCSV